MDTLDFGEIMEQNNDWFDDYDLSCPFCDGTGEVNYHSCECNECGHEWETERVAESNLDEIDITECPSCQAGAEKIMWCTEQESCQQCTDGRFEIMWDTAYGVHISDVGIGDRTFAWEMGFCLIEHSNERYLLMGSCGQDNTWRIHYTRWQIQGYLNDEDITDCLGSGGYVFLGADKRKEMLDYFKEELTTPEQYAKIYARRMEQLDSIYPE